VNGRSQRHASLQSRIGGLLLLLGAALLAVPAARWAREEIAYRRLMAQASAPSPVMLVPGEAAAAAGGNAGGPSAAPPGGSMRDPGNGGGEPASSRPGESDAVTNPAGNGGGHSDGGAAPRDGGEGPGEAAPAYWISIPRLEISYRVGEGVDNPVLDAGPGHYPQTVLPGEVGNAAMAGHRTIRGRPAYFYRLNELEPGDRIHIRYDDRSLTFVVERVFVTDPYDLSVLAPTDYPALTLTTCDPPGSDEMRLIVQARLQREA